MKDSSRKSRIEHILTDSFLPCLLIVRDDSKKHEGHFQIDKNSKETHFFIKMRLKDYKNFNRLDIHKKVYKLLNNEFNTGLHALELDLNKN